MVPSSALSLATSVSSSAILTSAIESADAVPATRSRTRTGLDELGRSEAGWSLDAIGASEVTHRVTLTAGVRCSHPQWRRPSAMPKDQDRIAAHNTRAALEANGVTTAAL